MGWTAAKNDLSVVFDMVIKTLKALFSYENKDGQIVFYPNNSDCFSVVKMGNQEPWDFVVIEYLSDGEDGDAFYPKDYDDFDDFISAILHEIDTNNIA